MAPPKNDQSKKPPPRRLFSFDSIKSNSSRSSSEAASFSNIELVESSVVYNNRTSNLKPLHLVEESRQDRSDNSHILLETNIVESPQEINEEASTRLGAGALASNASYEIHPGKPSSTSANASHKSGMSGLSVSSKARWEHLRQAVLPPNQPSTPYIHSQQSSTSSFLPPRSQTPKPSRLARLGFRQVVEQAREVVVDDSRKFADEVQKACWSARYVEPMKSSRTERDQQSGTIGSSLYLPFTSIGSLPTTGNSSSISIALPSNKKHELRRPQSVQSLVSSSRSVPSLKYLYHTLLHHASISMRSAPQIRHLPHEKQVLSAMLWPFLTSDTSARMDEEKFFSVECFDLIIKTWEPPQGEAGIERCLWCCKALLIPASPLRLRILRCLHTLVTTRDNAYSVTTPDTFQTLVQALLSLLPFYSSPSTSGAQTNEAYPINELIVQIQSGCGGDLDRASLAQEYNTEVTKNDNEMILRQAMISEAYTRCLVNGAELTRRWLLRNAVELCWPLVKHNGSITPLQTAIHLRKLNTFCSAALTVLSSRSSGDTATLDRELIVRLLQTRVIPEVDAINQSGALEVKKAAVRLVLELIGKDSEETSVLWAISLVQRWYQEGSEWKLSFDQVMQNLIMESSWDSILRILPPLLNILSGEATAVALPIISDRLIADPPGSSSQLLTELLVDISRTYPRLLYKPLFACAASSKDFAVINHLCTVTAISKFLPDFWIREAEMMAIALMPVASGSKEQALEVKEPALGKVRLGQSILMIELIEHIRSIRRAKELSSIADDMFVQAAKFVVALESRLSILLDAKERNELVPSSQRLLFCVLFTEMRLLTRSLKASSWLSRLVLWFDQLHFHSEMNDDSDVEVIQTLTKMKDLYLTAKEGVRTSHQRRSTLLLSPIPDKKSGIKSPSDQNINIWDSFTAKAELLLSLSQGAHRRFLKLMVALSALLTLDDYRRIGPLLWSYHLDNPDAKATASACFLIMQCAEKVPLEFLACVEVDLRSSDAGTRLQAIRRISTLCHWRFQILSQHVVVDRMHRPFRLARGPLPFVATDIGSSLYVRIEDPNELKDSLPLELRRRLSEIGWGQDDEAVDQKLEWMKTPIALLPSFYADRLESGIEQNSPLSPNLSPASPSLSPTSSPKKSPDDSGLLRRNSSTGGPLYSTKRRAVFVPALAMVFPRLISLAFDLNPSVASGTQNIIMDLMRNDPSLAIRPILDLLADEEKNIPYAISSLRAILHIRRLIPPPAAHYVFNNLAGFLKLTARQVEFSDSLRDFAYTIPILSKLITQVSDMSIRDIRRAKVEAFFVPSGSLWFSSLAPTGPMFPRSLGSGGASHGIPAQLVSICMIRTSQQNLFLAMLKRNPQDVQMIRKNMSRLVLPSYEDSSDTASLDLKDFISHQTMFNYINYRPQTEGVKELSLMVSRSYLLLVAQIFRSTSRHLSDRNELAILVDGLNRILLVHGDDIGIVGQTMIALMVASTRFQRLFTTGGGYTLFMPAVVKVYADQTAHSGIRSAIEYAVNRFYALHREAFLFQSLDIMARVTMIADAEGEWIANKLYSLLSSLRRGVSPSAPDPAGIHNSNKDQEREALIVTTAETKPQTFLASLQQSGTRGEGPLTVDFPDEYESRRLGIDDFIRLFLTVIAHDPSIGRAEHFLRLFRLVTPSLYHASSSARSVLHEGIDALGTILIRAAIRPKAPDSVQRAADSIAQPMLSEAFMGKQFFDKSKSSSDISSMRLDYLSLIVAFTRAGGQLGLSGWNRVIDLIKVILRESTTANEAIGSFFADYTKAFAIREPPPGLKEILGLLNGLSPIISYYATDVDFSGVFDIVQQLAGKSIYSSEPAFSRAVISQICAPGLAICELAASEKKLATIPLRLNLIPLLAQSIFLRGADVVAEIEKRTPSYDFLVGIVLPLVARLKATTEMNSDGLLTESWHRQVQGGAWVRLLSYSMLACQKGIRHPAGSSQVPDRSKSQDKRRMSSKSQIAVLATALQVIKVIIVRAEQDLSTCLPGIWSRLALFLKSLFADGNAEFALSSSEETPLPSPTPSPRSSLRSDQYTHLSAREFQNPRIVDYSLWSMLELLCLFRSPLALQMRLFIQEKVVALDQGLSLRQPATQTIQDRPVSSVFAKPRRRMSRLPSPDTSPRMDALQSFSSSIASSESSHHQSDYRRFPLSPTNIQRPTGPRIVHLGPISYAPTTHPTNSNFGGFGARTSRIKSLSLVKATYRRIRLVQSCLGYDVLLPVPNTDCDFDGDEDGLNRMWTKKQALDAILMETQELMEEFEEVFRDIEDDMVMVDPDQSMTSA